MRLRVVSAVAMVVLTIGCENASPPTSPGPADVTGTWVRRTPESPAVEILTLTQSGTAVTGTYSSDNAVSTTSGQLTEGNINGNRLMFSARLVSVAKERDDIPPCPSVYSGSFDVSETSMTGPVVSLPQPPCTGRPSGSIVTYRRE